MKIMCFERTFRPYEVVVGVHPRVIRCVRETIRTGDGNTRRCRDTCRIQYVDTEPFRGLQVLPPFGDELNLCPRQDLLSPHRSIPATIRDKSDTLSIRRPARIDVVKISVGKLKGISSLGWHYPELMPRPPEIGRVHNSLAVRREIRPGLPRSLFIMNFARFGPRFS